MQRRGNFAACSCRLRHRRPQHHVYDFRFAGNHQRQNARRGLGLPPALLPHAPCRARTRTGLRQLSGSGPGRCGSRARPLWPALGRTGSAPVALPGFPRLRAWRRSARPPTRYPACCPSSCPSLLRGAPLRLESLNDGQQHPALIGAMRVPDRLYISRPYQHAAQDATEPDAANQRWLSLPIPCTLATSMKSGLCAKTPGRLYRLTCSARGDACACGMEAP